MYPLNTLYHTNTLKSDAVIVILVSNALYILVAKLKFQGFQLFSTSVVHFLTTVANVEH